MSLRAKFTGTGIAITTPFQSDGKIDWNGFKKLINFWIEGGVEYLVALGTTGESATIHGEEKQQVFSFLKEVNAGRLPLVAGIGGNDTQEVLASLLNFDLSGFDAILSVSPYYNKPNQEGIFQHYKMLNEQTPLPIIIYNVPSRTGSNVTAETQLRIANECNIAGNQRSRWTDFLTTDGEKSDRFRDSEFVTFNEETRSSLMEVWEHGWQTLFDAVEPLTVEDFSKTVAIRGEPHTIIEAINRQLTHYALHIGQILFLAKHLRSKEWKTLSVPKNKSAEFKQYLADRQTEGVRKTNRMEAPQEFADKETGN